jgi:cytoskeletal protein RodZ
MRTISPKNMRNRTLSRTAWLSALVIAVIFLGWLLLAWMTGAFPFAAEKVTPQSVVPQAVIDSLSAGGTSPVAPSTGTINSLTAPAGGTSAVATTTTSNSATQSVLDSLSPKK